ncbi:zinc finger protein Eos [Dunckerocampus dactyliophorus]|uniref:zinc finger protein Eos n=1 Tax=Dunckerocampus dactyliophorus TaxID=161453 RepID=UPI002404CEAA|nr:zinc finger protein Eos [Dunckerocampus dactyliophorus]XP_054641410.1 zinc finger protein Eos [Dunckerocampus dactyliophorus]
MQASGERMNADDCNGCSYASGNGKESSTEQDFYCPNSQESTHCSFTAHSIKVELCSEDESPQPDNRGAVRHSSCGDGRTELTEEESGGHTGVGQGNLYSEMTTSNPASPGPIRLASGKLQCEVCGIVCIGPNVLMVHKRSHTGERPFQCNQCGASFTQKGNLLRHIKLHSGEKPFKCPICSYACRRRDALAGHLRTHAVSSQLGGKPFKCSYCSRSYKQQSTLEDHRGRCHSFLKSQDQQAAINTQAVQQGVESLTIDQMTKPAHEPSNEKPHFVERLAVSITKRKRSTPQKFLAEKHIHLDLPEAPYDLSSGSEREGEHLTPQPAAECTRLGEKQLQDSRRKGENPALSQLHPAFLSELRTVMRAIHSNVPPQEVPSGLTMVPLGLSGQEAGEGCEGHPSVHGHTTSTNGCPDSTDTESTAEEHSTRAAAQISTSTNNQHLPDQTLGLPHSLPTSSPSQAKEMDTEWDRVCPAPPIPVKRSGGSPFPSRETVQVLDRDGQRLRSFHCRHCHILFLDHVMFTIHMGCHGFHQPFECNICGHRSRDRYEFSSHISRGEHQVP